MPILLKYWHTIGALALALLLGILYHFEKVDHAQTQLLFSTYKENGAKAVADQTLAYRALEQSYAAFRETALEAYSANVAQLSADAAAANGTAGRLQQLVNKTTSRCRAAQAAGVASGSKGGADPGVLLSDMHKELTKTAREMAEYADRTRERHSACQKIADNEK